jgi:hypothetical protein
MIGLGRHDSFLMSWRMRQLQKRVMRMTLEWFSKRIPAVGLMTSIIFGPQRNLYVVRMITLNREGVVGGVYNEQLTMWIADSPEQACDLARSQTADYCRDVHEELLDYQEVWQMFDYLRQGGEVFTSLRESSLDPDDYVSRYFSED